VPTQPFIPHPSDVRIHPIQILFITLGPKKDSSHIHVFPIWQHKHWYKYQPFIDSFNSTTFSTHFRDGTTLDSHHAILAALTEKFVTCNIFTTHACTTLFPSKPLQMSTVCLDMLSIISLCLPIMLPTFLVTNHMTPLQICSRCSNGQ